MTSFEHMIGGKRRLVSNIAFVSLIFGGLLIGLLGPSASFAQRRSNDVFQNIPVKASQESTHGQKKTNGITQRKSYHDYLQEKEHEISEVSLPVEVHKRSGGVPPGSNSGTTRRVPENQTEILMNAFGGRMQHSKYAKTRYNTDWKESVSPRSERDIQYKNIKQDDGIPLNTNLRETYKADSGTPRVRGTQEQRVYQTYEQITSFKETNIESQLESAGKFHNNKNGVSSTERPRFGRGVSGQHRQDERHFYDPLADIEAVNDKSFCAKFTDFRWAKVEIPITESDSIRDKALLAARLLALQLDTANQETLRHFVKETLEADKGIYCIKVLVGDAVLETPSAPSQDAAQFEKPRSRKLKRRDHRLSTSQRDEGFNGNPFKMNNYEKRSSESRNEEIPFDERRSRLVIPANTEYTEGKREMSTGSNSKMDHSRQSVIMKRVDLNHQTALSDHTTNENLKISKNVHNEQNERSKEKDEIPPMLVRIIPTLVDSFGRNPNVEVSQMKPSTFAGLSPWINITEMYYNIHMSEQKNPYGTLEQNIFDRWTEPYYSCEYRKWVISHLTFMKLNVRPDDKNHKSANPRALHKIAVFGIDLDVSEYDIDQCEATTETSASTLVSFHGTHKCHNISTECHFQPGKGWARGSYTCKCRKGFYSVLTSDQQFNGSMLEEAFRSFNHTDTYRCIACAQGCESCSDDSPCLATYHWPFRITLLAISVLCILLTLVLAVYVYRFRRVKVIKAASPVFLCITLLGCAIMYCEMAAIFPVLDAYCCVATKWTRHMGFCITYSALLLKTWRVSLTYRVKSAHKLKLTDRQLLHWLFPILLEVAIFLGTWTISSPPEGIYIKDWSGLKFKICEYNWWDHTIAFGELLFLLWGIRVCYSVRHAQSLFNEARHISVAIYNIALVNTVMMLFHLVLLPEAGPDTKYLFGFVRTQLSTSVTVALVFGPKFYRLLRGEGDSWESRSRARGVSLNGITTGLGHEETQIDPYQENEELKEEVQRLAAQIELMKIANMEHNNRHLKSCQLSKSGLFGSSPPPAVVKAMYMKLESSDSPGSRVSPAAELVSERV